MIEVYGVIPEYGGRGRHPTRKRARPGWQYLQMVKQRNEHGHLQGIKLRVVCGKKSEGFNFMCSSQEKGRVWLFPRPP
jgi:hypothetical protein